MCCCCRKRCRDGCRDVVWCIFMFVFTYIFLPAATVFQAVWGVGMATSSVKDLHFMLTGNRSLEGVPPPYDAINTPLEYGVGVLVIMASGLGFAAYFYIRYRAKLARRRGALLPYTMKAVPMSTLAATHGYETEYPSVAAAADYGSMEDYEEFARETAAAFESEVEDDKSK